MKQIPKLALLTCIAMALAGCERQPERQESATPTDELAFLRESKPPQLAERLQLDRALNGNQDALYQVLATYLFDPSKFGGSKANVLAFLERQAAAGNWRAAKALADVKSASQDEATRARRAELLKTTLQVAVDAGEPAALVAQGIYINAGRHWPKDQKLACTRWNDAAAKGDPMGMFFSARCAQPSSDLSTSPPDEALGLFENAAEKGSTDAARHLVAVYRARNDAESTHRAVTRLLKADDPSDAILLALTADKVCYFVLKAACIRNPDFASSVGKLDPGTCKPCSEQEAADGLALLKRSAELGYGRAAMSVAEYYRDADGSVPGRFIEWVSTAVALGDPAAMREMGKLADKGMGSVPRDPAVASSWLRKAAILGDGEAQWRLGVRMTNGTGMPRDVVGGYAWLNLAASERTLEMGDLARAARDTVAKEMSADQIAQAQRLSSQWKQGSDISGDSSAGAQKTGGSGTFFYVSSDGKAVANAHVTEGCKELKLPSIGGASVRMLAADSANDLALLQVSGVKATPANLARDPGATRQGQEVLVYGFPLSGVLAKSGNLTPGVVSATSGLGGNSAQLQITAPIQPGSSGSPVLDDSGSVIGVVSQKLNDAAVLSATGSVPQGIGFAISGVVLRAFLDSHKVAYKLAPRWSILKKDRADLAEAARSSTGLIECLR